MTLHALRNPSSYVTKSGFNAFITKVVSIVLFTTISGLSSWAFWILALEELFMVFGPLDLVRNSAPNSISNITTSDAEFLQLRDCRFNIGK